MLGDFVYNNPTKIYFGKNALEGLKKELPKYGKNVLLIYGGGSIKKNGIYDAVLAILRECGKEVFEDAGVMPNPTVEKLQEGCERARAVKADFFLAVGGGSVCDYAKALSASVNCTEDPWDKYFIRFEEPDCEVIPIGCVLTMVGTGSEMNGGSVITNYAQKLKIGHVFGAELYPRFSILNPEYTYTLPEYQMKAGFFDIMCHILEQYLSDNDDSTSDYIAEGLMRSLIVSTEKACVNPRDYEARSNIMWTATWALNTLIEKGKTTDWEVHMIGQGIGAHTNATHGMTLSAVALAYYHFILDSGLDRFARFAVNVWGVRPEGKTKKQVAEEGLDAMKAWMQRIGVVMNIRDLGVTEDMIEGIADSTALNDGGYKPLTRDDVVEILKASM